MAAVELTFLGEDGSAGRDFVCQARDGWIALPKVAVVVGAGEEVWVDRPVIVDCRPAGSADPRPAQDVAAALALVWSPADQEGHSSRLPAPEQRWLDAASVTVPCSVVVTWEVRHHLDGPYQRYVGTETPRRETATVTLTLEPAATGDGRRERSAQAAGHSPSGPPANERRHRGHVAVDFGTSNCTVALFDYTHLPGLKVSALQIAQLRTAVIDLLWPRTPGGTPGPSARELDDLVEEVAATTLSTASGSRDRDSAVPVGDRLRGALRSEQEDRDPALLYAVLVELEKRVGGCSDTLRRRLSTGIHRAYQQAWTTPALDMLRIFPVTLDAIEGTVVESKVKVFDPYAIEVGTHRIALGDEDDEHDEGDDGFGGGLGHSRGPSYVFAGLKQRLGDPEPLPGVERSADELIQAAFGFLLDRTNQYIAGLPTGRFDRGRVDHAVITYPTMATPAVRQQIRRMLTAYVSRVDTSYDEAVAAALYFLMRDFGGNHDIGLEVLISQSTPVPNSPGHWKQNILVIDIGGGTTDIALLALGLHDATPVELRRGTPSSADGPTQGRYYRLRPELLASTGRSQHGGELTTLRVFHWIKAILGDALCKRYPERFNWERSQLAKITDLGESELPDGLFARATRNDLPPPDSEKTDAFDLLDRVVPTRSKDGAQLTQAFWLLWNQAEIAKRQLFATERDVELDELRVAEILRAARSAADQPDPLGDNDAADLGFQLDKPDRTLSFDAFGDLVSHDLEAVMRVARRMVEKQLGAGPDAQPLDRVIMTGQASQPKLVRRVLLATFTETNDADEEIAWRPSSVTVETEYSKHAAALGACWAGGLLTLGPRPAGAADLIEDGRSQIDIDVRNLLFNLPCAFYRGTQFGGQELGIEVLPAGEELRQLYPGEDRALVRSTRPFQLPEKLPIYREDFGNAHEGRPQWGDFQWRDAAAKAMQPLDEEVWADQIWAFVEASAELDLYLLLFRPTDRSSGPHYRVEGEGTSVLPAVDRSTAAAAERDAADPATADVDPDRIVVNAYSSDGRHQGQPVFLGAAAGPGPARTGADRTARFPEDFRYDGKTLGGRRSSPLPATNQEGRWTFHYRDDAGGLHHIDDLEPPRRTGTLPVEYFATVDSSGQLRVHAGEVPFHLVESLLDVERDPGGVLRTPMHSLPNKHDGSRDPFSGRH